MVMLSASSPKTLCNNYVFVPIYKQVVHLFQPTLFLQLDRRFYQMKKIHELELEAFSNLRFFLKLGLEVFSTSKIARLKLKGFRFL